MALNDNNLKAFLYAGFQRFLKKTWAQIYLIFAVKNHYWYQMYLDDLPIWGIVGEIDDKAEDYYVWTHKKFEIGYNNDQVGLFK